MSNLSPFGRRGRIAPAIPRGDVLGTYETYLEAQSVVDRLSKADFEIKGLAIVGNNLTTVEQVTGKLSYGRTALAGAARGAWFGLFIGLMFFLFTPVPVTGYIVAAAVIGAGISMVFSVVMYTLGRRTRDFTSTNHVLARSYDIIISPQLLLRARTILAQPGLAPASGPDLSTTLRADAASGPGVATDADATKNADAARNTGAVTNAGVAANAGSAAKSFVTEPSVPSAGSAPSAESVPSGESGEPAPPVAPARARPAYGELAPEISPAATPVATAWTAPAAPVAPDDPAARVPRTVPAAPVVKPRAKRASKPPQDPETTD